MDTTPAREARRHAVIVTGGDPPDPRTTSALDAAAALVVAADSGLVHAHQLGLHVDVVVGDLDSVPADALRRAVADGAEVEQHPVDKDATDLELALAAVAARGVERVVVLGGGGGRLDHFLANLLVLADTRFARVAVEAHVGTAELHVVRDEATLHGEPGDRVSLLPMHGDAAGVRTTNLKFPLRGEILHAGSTRGVSNEFVAAPARVTLTSGALLAILPDARKEH